MLSIIAALLVHDPVVSEFEVLGFRTTQTIEINAPREAVWDAATGDVLPWWDHTYSGGPAELVIEPTFGGRFYERFEAGSDDGMLHAEVIFANAPQTLRLHGPLGLTGRSYNLVTSWTLEATDDGRTLFTVDLAMHGEIDENLAGIVHGVWTHFIGTRLKTYMETGCYLEPQTPCAAFESPAE